MSKQRRHSGGHEGDNHERWLITYADMITLLMAFFIMMYSMSVVDLKKFEDLASAMGHIFGGGAGTGSGQVAAGSGQVAAGSGLLSGRRGVVPAEGGWTGEDGAAVVRMIQRQMANRLPSELSGTVKLTRSARRITVSMQANAVTFPVGQATLTAQARQILAQLGAVLSQVHAPMLVEGHTCDLPISTPQFPSNWELSAARANAVMLFLVRQCHIAPERIATVGFAATRPRVPNTSEANRARNRRVDIVILPDDQARLDRMLRDPGGPPEACPEDAPAPEPERSARPDPVELMPPMALAAEYHARQAAEASDPTRASEAAPGNEEEQP